MSFTYIASPYSHPDPEVRKARFDAAMEFTAHMLRKRVWCYSPIVHCHELALAHRLPYDFDFWGDYNRAMIRAAKHLIVLQLDGWRTSRGVAAEITFADDNGIPVSYMYPSAGGFASEGDKNPRTDSDIPEIKDRATPSL